MSEGPVEVSRRLLAWDARLRFDVDASSVIDGLDAAIGEHPVVGLAVAACGLALVLVAPFLLLAVELAVLVAVTVAVLLARLVLRRPWVIEARRREDGRVVRRWQVSGFRRAGRAQQQLAALAAWGGDLPPSGRYDPDTDPPP